MPCVECQHNIKYKNKSNGLLPSFWIIFTRIIFHLARNKSGKIWKHHYNIIIPTTAVQNTNDLHFHYIDGFSLLHYIIYILVDCLLWNIYESKRKQIAFLRTPLLPLSVVSFKNVCLFYARNLSLGWLYTL